MSEPMKRQTGESSDNYGNATRKMVQVAKQTGKTVKEAAIQTTRATANAAASTVKAGTKVGKAVANMAKGTAVGGLWGAIISVAWSLRNTLFKILVSVCMFLLILILVIVSLPSILIENILGLNKNEIELQENNALYASYEDLSSTVIGLLDKAYDATIGRIKNLISINGYDYSLSMKYMNDKAKDNRNYDVCYILAAYSVSMGQNGTSKANLEAKIGSVSESLFPVSYTTKTIHRLFDGLLGIIEVVTYMVCTVSPFNMEVLLEGFGLDLDEPYRGSKMTNGDYVDFLAESMRKTLGDRV